MTSINHYGGIRDEFIKMNNVNYGIDKSILILLGVWVRLRLDLFRLISDFERGLWRSSIIMIIM